MTDIYKGRCPAEKTDELLNMLNKVFFAQDNNEETTNFLKLLPKLYKNKYNPAYNNFSIIINNEIKAAVGLYPMTASVLGRKLRIGGIGNVAVSGDSRGKGYMIDCMQQCLDQMISDGTDYSILGGQRQRYQNFGYDSAGNCINFEVDRDNIRHILGKDYKTSFTAREISAGDTDILRKIDSLHTRNGIYVERNLSDYDDVLRSWESVPFAVFNCGEFAGYFSSEKNGDVREMLPVKLSDTLDIILCIMDKYEKNRVSLDYPVYETEICDFLSKCCSYECLNHSELVNILNYKNFISAFLSAKASRVSLQDGVFNMLIHGWRCDEQLRIEVKNGAVFVNDTPDSPDIELDHLEAIQFIGAVYCKKRDSVPAYAASWFPVDFFSYCLDNV